MTVAFRNVDVTADSDVADWPFEALVTAIERGTLQDWVRITAAIDSDPWGPVARQVEDYLGYEAPYGVGPLLSRAIVRSRREADEQDRADVAAEVGELVAASGLSMAELASRLGTSRTRLSTYRSGRVVPSAAMMRRLRRTVARLNEGPPGS